LAKFGKFSCHKSFWKFSSLTNETYTLNAAHFFLLPPGTEVPGGGILKAAISAVFIAAFIPLR
jgi:hypothetical protein